MIDHLVIGNMDTISTIGSFWKMIFMSISSSLSRIVAVAIRLLISILFDCSLFRHMFVCTINKHTCALHADEVMKAKNRNARLINNVRKHF